MSNPAAFYENWGREKRDALRSAYRKLSELPMSMQPDVAEKKLDEAWGQFRDTTRNAYVEFEQRCYLANLEWGFDTPMYWQEWKRFYEDTSNTCRDAHMRFVDSIAEDLVALVYEPANL